MRRPRIYFAALLVAGCVAFPASAELPRNFIALLDATALTTAVTASTTGEVRLPVGTTSLSVQANFDYGSSGTTLKVWLQTSLDGGATWWDIANFAFTTSDARRGYNLTNATVTSIATPSDGALADNTVVNGILGDRIRLKYTSTGTYAGATTIDVDVVPRGE